MIRFCIKIINDTLVLKGKTDVEKSFYKLKIPYKFPQDPSQVNNSQINKLFSNQNHFYVLAFNIYYDTFSETESSPFQ